MSRSLSWPKNSRVSEFQSIKTVGTEAQKVKWSGVSRAWGLFAVLQSQTACEGGKMRESKGQTERKILQIEYDVPC